MDPNTEDLVKKKILNMRRKAYEIAKLLRSISDRNVSYIISTEINLQADKIIPTVKIKEYPDTRVAHSLEDADSEILVDVDIDNVE